MDAKDFRAKKVLQCGAPDFCAAVGHQAVAVLKTSSAERVGQGVQSDGSRRYSAVFAYAGIGQFFLRKESIF